MSKTIPEDERVQVVTEQMLQQDAMTIRNDENGTDIQIFGSEDAEGSGIPFRTDDEFAIREEQGWGFDTLDFSDGLWMETVSSSTSQVQVLKGVALERNVRRDVRVSATVSSNTYPNGADFDTAAGDSYPVEMTNSGTIEEVLLSIVEGEVNVEIDTVDGGTVVIPVDQKASIESYSAESVTITDPSGTTPRVAGGWAGE
ncbi:hypothetical protein [Natronomonas gomsonensis]|uniref:hypothetical protein n=1 Tax=Natronomonas gomsonensis TaxID=1046043 RepID=UPI0015BD969C|nr:hypothetical protein [Natronomonas gomsonensis]